MGLSDQKIKKGTFVRVEKLSFWESPIKIRDVAGIPNVRNCSGSDEARKHLHLWESFEMGPK